MLHSVDVVVLIINMCNGWSLFVIHIKRKVMSGWVRITRLNVKVLGRNGSGRVGPGNSYKMCVRTDLSSSVIDL